MAIDGKTKNRQRKQQSILEAAIQEFRDKGYDGASMDRVAELAKASKRTVYNHFPSKEELFIAVIDLFLTEMAKVKHISYNPERDLKEQLYAFADAELALTKNPTWKGFTQILLSLFLRNSDLAKKISDSHPANEDSLTIWMRSASDDGKLTMPDAQIAAQIFTAMISGAFTWPTMYNGSLDIRYTERMKQELVETFLARFQKKRNQ
jgi:TetR/AcrR family transcriptional regulator, regulator of autoinduction and epiphytic fitness